jgi:hypothetical protein
MYTYPTLPPENVFLKTVFTGLLIYAVKELVSPSEQSDTVNYQLFWKGRIVYEGIAYADRIMARIGEHERSDKVFDEYDFDYSKPRSKALDLEFRRIQRNRPKYNICHMR